LFFLLRALLKEFVVAFFLFSNVVCISSIVFFNLRQWFLWILLLMHKQILNDFCQY
jgi:hypothetical protein